MAFIYLYKNGSFWNAVEIEDEGTSINTPSRMSPTNEYGSWSSWYNLTYNHIVKTPTSPTQTSSNTYYSYLPRRERTVTTTTYSNDWAAKLVRNGITYSYTVASDTSWLVTFDGQYDINIYYTPKSSSQSTGYEYDYGSWSGDSYTLPAVNFDGYTQKDYSGSSSSYSHGASPGSSFWAPDLTKWDGWFPFENILWSPSYEKLVYKLNLNYAPGLDGTNEIYYWATKGWYSDSTATNTIEVISIPTRTGYSFGGYYVGEGSEQQQVIKSNGEIISEYTISSDTTAKAKWTANTYTVSFDVHGNVKQSDYPKSIPTQIDDITMVYDTQFGTLPEPIREGFKFKGWIDSNGNTIEEGKTFNPDDPENYTLHAVWERLSYTAIAMGITGVSWVSIDDGTQGVRVTKEDIPYYTEIKLFAKVDEGTDPAEKLVFSNWSVGDEILSDSPEYKVNLRGDTTFIAKAGTEVRTYTVTVTAEDEVLTTLTGIGEVDLGWYGGQTYNPSRSGRPPISNTFEYGVDVDAKIHSFSKFINNRTFEDLTKDIACESYEYRFEWIGWKFNGESLGKNLNYHKVISKNSTFTAVTKAHKKIKLTVDTDIENGSIKFNWGDHHPWHEEAWAYELPSRDPKWPGSSVIIEATPDPGYLLSKWIIGDREIPARYDSNTLRILIPDNDVVISAVFVPWYMIWEGKECHWNGYYIFVKTSDPDLPWKIVKEIKIKTEDTDRESDWKLSSKAPSQP